MKNVDARSNLWFSVEIQKNTALNVMANGNKWKDDDGIRLQCLFSLMLWCVMNYVHHKDVLLRYGAATFFFF